MHTKTKTGTHVSFIDKIIVSLSYFFVSLVVLSKVLDVNGIILILSSFLIAFTAYTYLGLKLPPKNSGDSKVASGLWIPLSSALFSLLAIQYKFENINYSLKNFTERTIGIAVLEGVDISLRSWSYVSIIALFILIFSFLYYVFFKTDIVLSRYVGPRLLANERRMLFSISLVSIIVFVLHYLNGAMIYVNILHMLLYLFSITYVMLGIKMFYSSNRILSKLLNNYNLIVLSLILPFVPFFTRWLLVKGSFMFTYEYFPLHFIFLVFFWIGCYLLTKGVVLAKRKSTLNSILFASIPLLLIPVSIPISNEIQFSLSGLYNFSARGVSIFTVSTLSFLSLVMFFLGTKRTWKDRPLPIASYVYFPLLIVSVVVFNEYKNFINIPIHLDMFHQGEDLITIQQLFSHGSIPFVNIYPTHGISSLVSQFLYSVVNGYKAFEPWLWEWGIKIFEIVFLYFVTYSLTNSFFATLSLLFLPLLGVFGGTRFIYGHSTSLANTYYLFSFAMALSFIWLVKKPSYRRLVAYWFACVFFTAWRVDFGIACFVSAIFILMVQNLFKLIDKRVSVINFKQVLSSLFLVGIFTASLGAFASYIGNESLSGLIGQAFEFVKFQAQAQGLINIAASYSPVAIFQYFLLPLIGVFYVLFFTVSALKKNLHRFTSIQYLLLFLAIFSLVMSLRSVQRQSLFVLGFNPYLFIFLGMAIPFYVKSFSKEGAMIFFSVALFAYQLFSPSSSALLKDTRLVNLYNWENKESRVRVNDSQYKEIASFLVDNLEGEQTFLDMTSSPMLYVVTDKKFVNYFIPSAYWTSDVIQDFSLDKIKKAYDKNEIPIVVFRQPITHANSIDGVPNEIRSYKIYEFIYDNYTPLGYVDGYLLWKSERFSALNANGLLPQTILSQEFDFKKLPYVWGTFDEKNASENTKILAALIDERTVINASSSARLLVENGLDKTTGNYVHLKLKSDAIGKLEINYCKTPESNILIDLVPSDTATEYLVRISAQYCWMKQEIDEVILSPSSRIEIVEAFIRKGD